MHVPIPAAPSASGLNTFFWLTRVYPISANVSIALAGRMVCFPEGQLDRSQARSAWDNATPKSRPVGYGVIRAGVRADSMIGVTKFQIRRLKTLTLSVGLAAPDHTVPYGTVLSEGRFPRHFVPGYDRAVPPGQRPFAHRSASYYLGGVIGRLPQTRSGDRQARLPPPPDHLISTYAGRRAKDSR
jgi:hypothetical protein